MNMFYLYGKNSIVLELGVVTNYIKYMKRRQTIIQWQTGKLISN